MLRSNLGKNLLNPLAAQLARLPVLVECGVQALRQLLGFQLQQHAMEKREPVGTQLLDPRVQSHFQTLLVGGHFYWLDHETNLRRKEAFDKPALGRIPVVHDAVRLRPHPYEFFLYYDV